MYDYRAAYPRYLGYERGPTYEPDNTDLSIFDWKVVGPRSTFFVPLFLWLRS